jgi:long-chain acyl-CoA synthetase
VRLAHVGWAPVPPEILRTWQVWGVDARVVYGLAETAGVVAAQERGFVAPSEAWAAVSGSGIALELGPGDELCARLPFPFLGYWNGPPGSARADGLLATGDRARLDGAEVRLAGALGAGASTDADLARIECAVKASPFLREAAAVVEPDGAVALFVEVSNEVVASWAQSRHIAYASFRDLAQRPEVEELARTEVAKASKELPEPVRVRRVRVLPFELHIGSDLLTMTGKVRRNAIRSVMEPDLV